MHILITPNPKTSNQEERVAVREQCLTGYSLPKPFEVLVNSVMDHAGNPGVSDSTPENVP